MWRLRLLSARFLPSKLRREPMRKRDIVGGCRFRPLTKAPVAVAVAAIVPALSSSDVGVFVAVASATGLLPAFAGVAVAVVGLASAALPSCFASVQLLQRQWLLFSFAGLCLHV